MELKKQRSTDKEEWNVVKDPSGQFGGNMKSGEVMEKT